MKTFLLCTILFTGYLSHAQASRFSIAQIDSIAAHIDSTCRQAGISEGEITNQQTGQLMGNFSEWYATDSSQQHLVKVMYEESSTDYNFTYYYFYNDQLIEVLIKRGHQVGEKYVVNSTGKYYFEGKKVISKADEPGRSFDKDYYLRAAKRYLGEGKIWRTLN